MSNAQIRNAPCALAEIATAFVDAGAIETVCDALRQGSLTAASTSVRHNAIAAGSGLVEARLRDLQELWCRLPQLSPTALALALSSAAESLIVERRRAARTEVVWTGPRAETSYLRATRQVVLDLLHGASTEVLVVGYWIVSNTNKTSIVAQIIEGVARAARRGARIKIILDQAARPGGERNLDQIMTLWPRDLNPPPLFTWRGSDNDSHLKLHAKVIVADRKDALVTSANLTMHAMDLNMEMGVRVLGAPAASIADHFDLLIKRDILQPYVEEA